jgi:hypothetical protein
MQAAEAHGDWGGVGGQRWTDGRSGNGRAAGQSVQPIFLFPLYLSLSSGIGTDREKEKD